jgi:hypothetical protein
MISRRSFASAATALLALGVVVGVAVPASAQYRPLPGASSSSNAPKGEPFHVEFGFNLWNPLPDIVINSESLGIPGSDINVQADLAFEQKQTYELRLVLRASKKNKFRFQYLPLSYEGKTVLKTELIFNGIKFPV